MRTALNKINNSSFEVLEDIGFRSNPKMVFIPKAFKITLRPKNIKINETKYVDHIDTPENRFYKNFLLFIDDLIDDLIKRIDEGYCLDKLYEYKQTLSYYLSSRYFLDISPMDYPPLNSQVLQKREGYRDILEYYCTIIS